MEIIIKPKKILSLDDFFELWRYRELLYFLVWRSFKVHYKQTFIGVAWVFFQPLVTAGVFSIFFGKFINVPSDGVPYPIFVFVGVLFWQFFSGALLETGSSITSHAALVTKVYCPRLLIPLSTVVVKSIDFFIASTLLVVLMVVYHYTPRFEYVIILPIIFFIAFLSAAGGGMILTAINVKYRDVQYIAPFFVQLLLFFTPVIYPPSLLKDHAWLLALNPMTGVIQSARSILFGTPEFNFFLFILSASSGCILFFVGIFLFKKMESSFADLI